MLPNQYIYDDAGNLIGGYEFFVENGITYQRHFNGQTDWLSVHQCSPKLVGNLILRPDVTWVSDSAFYQCENLFSIRLPAGVTHIEELAFDGCTLLTEVTMPAGVCVDVGAFNDCHSLRRIVLTGDADAALLTNSLRWGLTEQQLCSLTLCGAAGSAAQQAARNLGCAFEAL